MRNRPAPTAMRTPNSPRREKARESRRFPDVGTRDHQQCPDHCLQAPKCLFKRGTDSSPSIDLKLPSLIWLMELLLPTRGYRVEDGLKLSQSDALPQSAKNLPRAVLRVPGSGQFFGGKNMRNPKLAFSPPEGELDVRRHDPDDGVIVSTQLDGIANQFWTSTTTLL